MLITWKTTHKAEEKALEGFKGTVIGFFFSFFFLHVSI
jgi:hypothetical protein